MLELSPTEAVVFVAWVVGIGCAGARLRSEGARVTTLIVLTFAILVPVLGSLVAMAATVRGARSRGAPSA